MAEASPAIPAEAPAVGSTTISTTFIARDLKAVEAVLLSGFVRSWYPDRAGVSNANREVNQRRPRATRASMVLTPDIAAPVAAAFGGRCPLIPANMAAAVSDAWM